jgi:hypothetical protein
MDNGTFTYVAYKNECTGLYEARPDENYHRHKMEIGGHYAHNQSPPTSNKGHVHELKLESEVTK